MCVISISDITYNHTTSRPRSPIHDPHAHPNTNLPSPTKQRQPQRAHFEAWITQCESEGKPLTSPMTRQPVSPIWFPNRSIRERVEEYVKNLKGEGGQGGDA